VDEFLSKSCPVEDFDISGFEPLDFPTRQEGRVIHLITYIIIANLFNYNSPLDISDHGKIKCGFIAVVFLKKNDLNQLYIFFNI
jgi:hypothetical protein